MDLTTLFWIFALGLASYGLYDFARSKKIRAERNRTGCHIRVNNLTGTTGTIELSIEEPHDTTEIDSFTLGDREFSRYFRVVKNSPLGLNLVSYTASDRRRVVWRVPGDLLEGNKYTMILKGFAETSGTDSGRLKEGTPLLDVILDGPIH